VSVDLYSIDATLSAKAPDLPGNLAATTVSSSHIVLAWTDNSNNESGFKIERSTNGTSFTQIVTVGTNVKATRTPALRPRPGTPSASELTTPVATLLTPTQIVRRRKHTSKRGFGTFLLDRAPAEGLLI
jgi:hypothetical protein